ncbi:MAG: C39 family peptidase [Candidatus Gracilibacteria bacterium]
MKYKIFLSGLLVAFAVVLSPVTAYAASSVAWSQVSQTLDILHGDEIGSKGDSFFNNLAKKTGTVTVSAFFDAYRSMDSMLPIDAQSMPASQMVSPMISARARGFIDTAVKGSDLVTPELFASISARDMIVQKYKPYIMKFERGLVRSPAEVNEKSFSSRVEIKEILVRYNGYLSRAELPDWMKKELGNRKNQFIALDKVLERKEKEAQALVKEDLSKQRVELAVKFYKQQRNLSCEMASLRSLLSFYGKEVAEKDLLATLGVDGPVKMTDGVWGDPQKGFVGNVDGKQATKTGYGTYWQAVARVGASYYDKIGYFEGSSVSFLTSSILEGKPVIIWGLLPATGGNFEITWKTEEGKSVTGYNGEHSYLVYGFVGPKEAPTKILVVDPWYGYKEIDTAKFDGFWSKFGRSGVRVQ